MKTLKTIIIILSFSGALFAQNITNTLGSSGTFTIKDASNTYFSLNQSNGRLTLISPLAGNQRGSIFKGVDRFLHTYNGSGTNGWNTFLGLYAGNFTMSGSGSQGSYNTGVGVQSLSSLTTGSKNSAFGNESLLSNTTGSENCAFGTSSLLFNTTGFNNSAFGSEALLFNTSGRWNSAFGNKSLHSNQTGYSNSAFGDATLSSNTTGYENSAFGNLSLNNNTSGIQNSAFGVGSLFSNTIGYYNSAFGVYSLGSNTTGIYNTALGHGSLTNNTTGNYNTAIGLFAGVLNTTGSNNLVIGYNAEVPFPTSSNQVRIGNTSITYAGIQVAWTVTSDRNLKSNILSSNLGLGFITKLRPVSYTRKNDESGKTEYGLIAQEVEEVLQQEGAENTGMLTITDDSEYQLRYNDLLAPMIKAIQELNEKNEFLSAENTDLKVRLDKYEQMQNVLAGEIEKLKLKDNNIKEVNSEINTVNQ
ncbi:MAG TPA: tail fiber domain-containing protein [Ignavibacteria bacterium]|nr:tail fiber domain-containing protein [Ignavibacteria bacterium]HRF66308.1 tail fiber domain-containing protein [Ignavibacteria bacterium]